MRVKHRGCAPTVPDGVHVVLAEVCAVPLEDARHVELALHLERAHFLRAEAARRALQRRVQVLRRVHRDRRTRLKQTLDVDPWAGSQERIQGQRSEYIDTVQFWWIQGRDPWAHPSPLN